MKTIVKIVIIATALFFMVGCDEPGVTSKSLTGYEEELPFELRGLKVYTVSTGDMSYVKVAILSNQINSLTYSVGKSTQTTIIVNNGSFDRVIKGTIISETDSIIVIKK